MSSDLLPPDPKESPPLIPMKYEADDEPITEFQVTPTDRGYLFRPPTSAMFHSVNLMFRDIRYALSNALDGRFLMVKFASRISCSNMPVIHDPRDLIVYIDPLQPYRDPVHQVNQHRVIELHKHVSFPSFTRKLARKNY